MVRALSGYQRRRQEAEVLGDLAAFLSITASILFVLITAEAAGLRLALPF